MRPFGILVCLTLAFLSTLPATSIAAPAVGDEAFQKAANDAIDQIVGMDGFSGAILVARGNRILLRRAAGLTDRERGIAAQPETKFPLESVTKQFTAAAILLLVQDGKLSLSDPISKYFPTAPAAWKKITIEQLLTHSSGIDDCTCTGKAYAGSAKKFTSYKDFIPLAEKSPLAFKPGSGFHYSNAGYALLTLVIERVSHETYGTFVTSRIFVPLSMTNSGYGTPPGDAVKGYVRSIAPDDAEEWKAGTPANLQILGGVGGLYSTVDDMLLWVRALDGNGLLSSRSRKAMFTDYGHNYGFGWRLTKKHERVLRWHTGNDPSASFASIVDDFPAEDLTVIALTNNTGVTDATSTLTIDGKQSKFPATAARKAVDQIESLYFTGK